jgi:hypothetical protein
MHAPLLSPVHATCPSPSHSSWFDYPNSISATYILFHSSATSYPVPRRSIYLPQHPFSNTLSLCSSLNVQHHVSRPVTPTLTSYILKMVCFSLYFLNILCLGRRGNRLHWDWYKLFWIFTSPFQ